MVGRTPRSKAGASALGLDVDAVLTAMVAVVRDAARIDDDRELGRGVRAIVRALSTEAADRATAPEDSQNVVDLHAAALAMARRREQRDSSV
jgi:hypothetical protein